MSVYVDFLRGVNVGGKHERVDGGWYTWSS
jgi:uncharacterized protein (DUF1697 family)